MALLALLLPELFLTSIFLKLLFLGRGGQREAEAVHSHDDGDILNMVEMRNEAGLEGGKNLFDASCQELLALLVGVRNYEAVHVHLRHFLCFQFLLIILKNVQELNCVNREIHVDVVGAAKVHRQTALLIVELFHRLPGAHVPAEHPPLHLVCKAVFLQVLVTVRVQIVGNHEQVLLGCPNCERTHSTEQVDQHLPGAHQLEESVSFLLEAGAPVDLLKVDPELYPPLLQRGLVLLGSCHVLKGGSSVHVMEFFRLVDHSFDVRALEESDLSDDSAPPFLTFCKVVVGDVPNRLEAPGKVNKLVITLVIAFREPVQDLLAVIIFKGKLLFYLPYSDVLKLFGKCLSIGLTVEEDDLFFFGELHNSGKTE